MKIYVSILSLCLATTASRADQFQFDVPSDDRWQYPFNATPGFRPIGTCFGAAGLDAFNDRDGSVIIAWDTSSLIAPGEGAENYSIDEITITLTNRANAAWPVDLTPDEWFSFDLNQDSVINADGIPRGQPGDTDGESSDSDPGRVVELFGAGFGPVFTAASWVETSIFVGSDSSGNFPRDPFPLVYRDVIGDPLHAEDGIKGLHNMGLTPALCGPPDDNCPFTATAWAIGSPVNYTPGSQTTPFDVVFQVDPNQAGGRVREYFQEGLNAGRVIIIVSSLGDAVLMGGQDGFPAFFMKESTVEGARPASIHITLSSCTADAGDIDCDGDVDADDLALFVGVLIGTQSNPDYVSRSDLDSTGTADGNDVSPFVNAYLQP